MTASVIRDSLNVVGPALTVSALLKLLGPDEGGKHQPIYSSYRPNHNFGGPDDLLMYIGQVEVGLNDEDKLHPGEQKEVTVRFLNTEGLEQLLTVGRTWRIQEGTKLVGTATVIQVHKDSAL